MTTSNRSTRHKIAAAASLLGTSLGLSLCANSTTAGDAVGQEKLPHASGKNLESNQIKWKSDQIKSSDQIKIDSDKSKFKSDQIKTPSDPSFKQPKP